VGAARERARALGLDSERATALRYSKRSGTRLVPADHEVRGRLPEEMKHLRSRSKV
jgi:hypothetical protein